MGFWHKENQLSADTLSAVSSSSTLAPSFGGALCWQWGQSLGVSYLKQSDLTKAVLCDPLGQLVCFSSEDVTAAGAKATGCHQAVQPSLSKVATP